MRVLRGRVPDAEADRDRVAALADWTAESGEAGLRVWRPHRQVAFGRRDVHEPGYDAAREAAEERGFPALERNTGGRAAAYTGSTVAFVRTEPIEDLRTGIAARYDGTAHVVQRVLWRLGVPAQQGEPPDSFCPGAHSLQWRGKLVGLAQRVRTGVATIGGIVIVRDHGAIAEVLAPVYAALDVPFDPESVGSLAKAGGEADPDTIVGALERELVGDADVEIAPADREL